MRDPVFSLRTAKAVQAGLQRSARLLWDQSAGPPVFVYQVGKVGSKSIEHSLRETSGRVVVHAHGLRKLGLLSKRIDLRLLLNRYIKQGRELYVITPVREPISRNISQFFEERADRPEIIKLETSTLMRRFLTNFGHTWMLRWFYKNFQPYLGSNVFEHAFEDGYSMYREGNLNILLFRIEQEDVKKEQLIADFLQAKDFKLMRYNEGNEKWYAEKYRRFKEEFAPPEWYVRMMYQSRYGTHFYGGLDSRWAKTWKRSSSELWI